MTIRARRRRKALKQTMKIQIYLTRETFGKILAIAMKRGYIQHVPGPTQGMPMPTRVLTEAVEKLFDTSNSPKESLTRYRLYSDLYEAGRLLVE